MSSTILSRLILSFIFFLFTAKSFAIKGVREPAHIQNLILNSIKSLNKSDLSKLKDLTSLNSNLFKLSKGQISSIEIELAVKKEFHISNSGTTQTISLMRLAHTINGIANYLAKINKEQLSHEGKTHLQILEKGLQIAPEFLALAALTSKSNSSSQIAFAKQLSFIETLFILPGEKMSSHIEIMELSIKNKLYRPFLSGEEAFILALRNKYGEKAEYKIDQLINCL